MYREKIESYIDSHRQEMIEDILQHNQDVIVIILPCAVSTVKKCPTAPGNLTEKGPLRL